jgi:hypothetical protein
MATPNEQLLSMLDPQQARLLDQQMRDQQVAQRSQGGGMLSGIVQAYTGMGDLAQRALGSQAPGANEQAALKQQQTQKVITDAMKVSNGKNRVETIRKQAQALRDTGDYNAFMKAEQLELQADQLALKLDELNVNRIKALATANKSTASGFSSTEGEHFADESGNQYATVLTTNKDTGVSEVNYIPLGNAPEYDGNTKLKAIIKSGSYVGLDPIEASELETKKEGSVVLAKDFNKLKVEAAQNYETAKKTHSSLVQALQMTKDAYEAGQLEGGIQANLQNVYYNLFGKRPKNLGELNMIFNESTFARLKPLFGGNISNGEREAVQGTYMDVLKGGQVNIGVIEQLIGKANGAMTNFNVLMTADSYDDWIGKLTMDKPKDTTTTVKRRRYNPETGKFEEVK